MSQSHGQIRLSQLITTFGPGSMMDLPNYSIIIGGLDHWDGGRGGDPISEPRLVAKLRAILDAQQLELRSPPKKTDKLGKVQTGITGWQFPEWFITQDSFPLGGAARSRMLVHRKTLTNGKYIDDDRKKRSIVPVRFVRACPNGHIGDIDWRFFVHRDSVNCSQLLYLDESGTTGDLAEIRIRCGCGKHRRMTDATQMELVALGSCNGSRPWLGPNNREEGGCGIPNRLLIRSASNAYFPQIMSVISIPDTTEPLADIVEILWDQGLKDVSSAEELAPFRKFNQSAKKELGSFSDSEVWTYVSKKRKGASLTQSKSVKQSEIETLLSAQEELGTDVPDGDFFARALPKSVWGGDLTESIEKIVLVHRLREVAALVGFTRFESQAPDIDGELDIDVKRAAIGRETNWLPAYENRGEGVFIGFKKAAIEKWIKEMAVANRGKELNAGFNHWLKDHEASERSFPGLPYYMLHSLSHMIITAMALECGYPSSSIKERIYAGDFGYGILLYTASPDSEGTLGGLVETGRNIKEHLGQALRSNMLCSNDPVCAQHDVTNIHDVRYLSGAACHGCLLISETSCEQHNDYLDRALVAPTVSCIDASFFEVK
ncbi:MAG: DUF1998 domain-containing protein [Parcubacteria group bacterium]|nr:DUF1998 domain-containing protein [Parcubacteria group bacterium]